MAHPFQIGWRIPDFPEGQAQKMEDRGKTFRDEIFNYLDVIHDHFDSAWIDYLLSSLTARQSDVITPQS